MAGLENAGAKKDIQKSLRIFISDGKPTEEIVMDLKVRPVRFSTGFLSVLLAGGGKEEWTT